MVTKQTAKREKNILILQTQHNLFIKRFKNLTQDHAKLSL